MEKPFSPPAWWASHSSEIACSSAAGRRPPRPASTSKVAPASPGLAPAAAQVAALAALQGEGVQRHGGGLADLLDREAQLDHLRQVVGAEAVDARPRGVGVGQFAEAPEQLQPLVAPAHRRAQRDPGAAAHAEHQEALARWPRTGTACRPAGPGWSPARRPRPWPGWRARARSRGRPRPPPAASPAVANSRQTPNAEQHQRRAGPGAHGALGVGVGHHPPPGPVGVVGVLEATRSPASAAPDHGAGGREQPAGRDLHPGQPRACAGRRRGTARAAAASASSAAVSSQLKPLSRASVAASSSSAERRAPGRVQPRAQAEGQQHQHQAQDRRRGSG